jgi:hypothetical protein
MQTPKLIANIFKTKKKNVLLCQFPRRYPMLKILNPRNKAKKNPAKHLNYNMTVPNLK